MKKEQLIHFFNKSANSRIKYLKKGKYYHKYISRFLKFLIPTEASVLHIGCSTGSLLNELPNTNKTGVDISKEMINIAKEINNKIEFEVDDFHNLKINKTYDYIIITNVIGYSDDIQLALKNLQKNCHSETKIIVIYFKYLWEPFLKFGEKIGSRMKRPMQHWLDFYDFKNLFELADYKIIKKFDKILLPINIPIISWLFNVIFANLPILNNLCLNQIIITKPNKLRKNIDDVTISVVVPCRNEKGNIENAILKTPEMGKNTEFIFVEGNSSDGTLDECYRVQKEYPDKDIKVFKQSGKGKGNAVRDGFANASGDVLMILDADLTTPPEDMYKFFNAIVEGKGEFINGSRLVYQMEDFAMRRLNLFGNKFFSVTFSFLLNLRLKDTLCGTKVLWKTDYEKIIEGRKYFGDFDPFGDFDLLFGAAKLNLDIVEIPIVYRNRIYGETQIKRIQHGWLLLKMCFFALRKIKFL